MIMYFWVPQKQGNLILTCYFPSFKIVCLAFKYLKFDNPNQYIHKYMKENISNAIVESSDTLRKTKQQVHKSKHFPPPPWEYTGPICWPLSQFSGLRVNLAVWCPQGCGGASTRNNEGRFLQATSNRNLQPTSRIKQKIEWGEANFDPMRSRGANRGSSMNPPLTHTCHPWCNIYKCKETEECTA
jgi:hypothetical protein